MAICGDFSWPFKPIVTWPLTADIDKRLEELQTELLKLATSNADYDKVGDEIHRLRDQKQKLLLESANRDELKKRITDMSTFLKKQPT
ncbi:MAG: hypothetical protein WCQ69_10965, partial [Bacteroidales bacterium]